MASTILVRDVIVGVQSALQDANPAFRRWPETDMIRYANYARMALAKYLPQVSSRTDDIKLSASAVQSLDRVSAANIRPGDGSVAADTDGIAFMRAVCNMGIDGLTVGKAIRGAVDRYIKDAYEPTWLTETGDEVLEIVFDKNQPLRFYVSPALPTSGNRWIRVQWMANLPPLPAAGAPGAEKYVVGGSEAARVLGVPDAFAEDVQNYMIAAALLKGSKNMQNVPKAQLHAQAFIQSINAQAQVATGTNPNLTVLPFISELGS
jgi:hypothetical protein